MILSLPDSIRDAAEYLDPETIIMYLRCPGTDVVLLQAHFDIYESVAIIRTLDIKLSLVSVITTPTMLQDCLHVLEGIKPQVRWEYAKIPADELKQKYLGYGKKGL